MTEIELSPPAEIRSESADLVNWAKSLVICNGAEYEAAAKQLKLVKSLGKKIVDFFKPLKQKQDEAKRAILDAEKEQLRPVVMVEELAKQALLKFEREQAAKAEEERRKLQAEADEKARRERERLEKLAATAKKPETVAKYQEAASQVAAPVIAVASEAPKVAGISKRKNWKAEITDYDAFLAFVFESKRFDLILPNQKAIDDFAKSQQDRAAMPGIRFFFEEVMSAGSR